VLLAIKLSLHCQMCDLHFKFETIRQKLRSLSRTIGISDRQTDRHTYIQVMLYLSNAMHCIGQTTISHMFHVSLPKQTTVSTALEANMTVLLPASTLWRNTIRSSLSSTLACKHDNQFS